MFLASLSTAFGLSQKPTLNWSTLKFFPWVGITSIELKWKGLSRDKHSSLIYSKTSASCILMEQRTSENGKKYLNTNIYSYLETSGVQSYYIYLSEVQCFSTSVN